MAGVAPRGPQALPGEQHKRKRLQFLKPFSFVTIRYVILSALSVLPELITPA
jgi:hypothetical protein